MTHADRVEELGKLAQCNGNQTCIDAIVKDYLQRDERQEEALRNCADPGCVATIKAALADSAATLAQDVEALYKYSPLAAFRLMAQQTSVGALDQTSIDLTYAEAAAGHCSAAPSKGNCAAIGKVLQFTATQLSLIVDASLQAVPSLVFAIRNRSIAANNGFM